MISGSLSLPGLTTISGTYQFEDCVTLTDFYAPLLTTIPQGMFNRCTGLASATFSPDLASIGQSAFENGGAMTSFSPTVLPKLTSFEQRAFRGQSKLAADFDLSLSTITTLPYYAFVDCAKVGRVTLPESLTTLGGGCLAYNKTGRVVWFLGAPPTTVDGSALDFRARGYLVAGIKHANEWKSDSRVAALEDSDKALSDYPGNAEVKESLGLQHTRPIGKWSTETGSYWHWVVEELPTGTVMLFR